MASTPVELRFWKKVVRSDNGCWLWSGATTHGGYGVINSGGPRPKIIRAHRLSWVIAHGEDPGELDVCHRCDTPACVRPEHLFLGDAQANAIDMVQKGRARGGPPCGEKHPKAKLTVEAVAIIRETYANGGSSLSALARQFSVSKKTILNTVKGRIWKV